MPIEVPSDKYKDAVQAMERRIRKGQVPGISDPADAKDLVRKGHVTYSQARNIARFGTIESLTYDAGSGVRLAVTSFGISAAVAFALAVWNGEDMEVAVRRSCMTGLRVGSAGLGNRHIGGSVWPHRCRGGGCGTRPIG